jgi:hypothetical protein
MWISVKDRLPDEGRDVLTYDGDNMLVEFIVNRGSYSIWSCNSEDDITHWMPLPEPPKGV